MLPLSDEDEGAGGDDDGDDNLTQLEKTGQIPKGLLKDILDEAGHYMALYNTNPSNFLNSQQLMAEKRAEQHPLKKKMTTGIISLTRPRFGKRSTTRSQKTWKNYRKRSLHGPSYVLQFLLTQDPKLKRALKSEGVKDELVDEEMRSAILNTFLINLMKTGFRFPHAGGEGKKSYILLSDEPE